MQCLGERQPNAVCPIWDTHVHLFDPDAYPLDERRSYTPGPARVPDLLARMRTGGIDRAVLVQPSVYGTDNSCLLAALDSLGGRALGVAVVDSAKLRASEIAQMQARGIRGFRVNLVSGAEADGRVGALQTTAKALAGSGMFLQIYAPLSTLFCHLDVITQAGVPVVLDHFAGIGAEGTRPG